MDESSPSPQTAVSPGWLSGRSSWRRQRRESTEVPRRWLRRILLSGLTVLLVAVLLWVVWRPWSHSHTHMLALTGADFRNPAEVLATGVPPVDFAIEDLAALTALEPVLYTPADQGRPLLLGTVRAPGEFAPLWQRLDVSLSGHSDVIVVYLVANGVSNDGQALLVWNFPKSPVISSQYPLRELLKKLADTSARTKLLVLDAGHLQYDPLNGMVVNEFPRLLAGELEAVGDPSLWILCSHSAMEHSNISRALRRSVFSEFVTRGLLGAADLDGNQIVRLDELFRYVSTGVVNWVQESSGGLEQQTPFLLGGPGGPPSVSDSPVLVPVHPELRPHVSPTGGGSTGDAPGNSLLGGGSRLAAASANAGGAVSMSWPAVSPAALPPVPMPGLPLPSAGVAVPSLSTPVGTISGPAVSVAAPNPVAAGTNLVAEPGSSTLTADSSAAAPPTADPSATNQPPEVKSSQAPAAATPQDAAPATHKATTGNPTSGTEGPAADPSGSAKPQGAAAPASSGSTAAPAGKSSSATPSPAAADSAKPAATDAKPGTTTTTASTARSELPLLIAESWQLRDALMSRQGGVPSPVDYAPHLWRKYEARLLWLEALSRAGDAADPEAIAANLKSTILSLKDFLKTPPGSLQAEMAGISGELALAIPQDPVWLRTPRSLAIVEAFGGQGLPSPTPELQAAITSYDTLRRAPTRDGLDKWIGQLSVPLGHYIELYVARQLLQIPEADWSLLQLALEVRRRGEQAACLRGWWVPAIRQQLEKADRLRLAAERLLLDQIDENRDERARRLLEASLEVCQAAEDDARFIQKVEQTLHDLVYRLRNEIDWRQACQGQTDDDGPQYQDLMDLMSAAATMCIELEQGGALKLPEFRKEFDRLQRLKSAVNAGCQPRMVQSLTTLPVIAGDAVRIETLLSTPLPGAAARLDLLRSTLRIESYGLSQFRLPSVVRMPVAFTGPSRNLWLRAYQQAELEWKHFSLVSISSETFAAIVRRLGGEFQELTETCQRYRAHAAPGSEEQMWTAFRNFGAALGELSRALPSQIESLTQQNLDMTDPASFDERLQTLKCVQRLLTYVDPRDVSPDTNPCPLIRAAEFHRQLSWQRQRFLAAITDAPVADVTYLGESAELYRIQAGEIPHQASIDRISSEQLMIRGPQTLSLTTQDRRDLSLTVSNSGSQVQRVWMMTHYDPRLLDVQPLGEPIVYRQETLFSNDQITQLAAAPDLPATFDIQPGETKTIQFRLQSLKNFEHPVPLQVKAVTVDREFRPVVRYGVMVAVPAPQSIEVSVTGIPESWEQTPQGYSLYPFPNRATAYQLNLRHPGATAMTVDLEFLAPLQPQAIDIPQASLSATDAELVLQRIGPTRSLMKVGKVVVPPGGKLLPFPFPKPAGSAPAPAKEGAAKSAGEAPSGPQHPPLPGNMLIMISDPQTGRKTFSQLSIATQRPRRFLRPRVSYDLEKERVEIRVLPTAPSHLPPEGVRVTASFADPLPLASRSELEGMVSAPRYEARMFAEIPSGDRHVTMYLHVDGYPRAFVYHVPCGADIPNVPEVTDVLAVRVTAPAAGTPWKTPVETISASVQVDAPVGTFQNGTDFLEVGIDRDRDRDFHAEPTVRLYSDRQVVTRVKEFLPDGGVLLQTSVSDFSVPLPTTGIQNLRGSVLARVFAGDQTAWSLPVDVIFDGSPPRIQKMILDPAGTVSIGTALNVSVLASDDELSGVGMVEAGFDVERKGMFAKAPPPVPATFHEEDGLWRVQLPTAVLKSGTWTLLVRATDKVGNVGEYKEQKVRVVTPEEAAKIRAAMTNRVSGIILYGGQGAAEVEVTLTSDKGVALPSVTSDEQGNFVLNKVPVGKYSLKVRGVIKNTIRQATQEITVEPPPMNGSPLRILLK